MKPCALFFLSSLLAMIQPLTAQTGGVVVDIGILPRLSIAPISGASEAATILSNDLRRTGEITPVGAGSSDFSASGSYSGNSLTGTLMSRKTGALVVNQTFSGAARSATHQFADAITKAVTGHPGFADSRLTYIAQHGGSAELYLADIDGFNARAITHDGVRCQSPALSPDGRKLAYTSYKSGYPDVYLIDLGTGSRTRIAYYPGINSGASFSPNGTRIALTLSKDGNPEIYTLGLDGGSPQRMTRTVGGETSPSWSPTGDRLVFSSDDRGSPQLYMGPADGSGTLGQRLVTGYSFCTKPDWAPDGQNIAFTTRIGGAFQLAVYNMASQATRLLTTSGGENPVWTRDSRHLVFDRSGQLCLLDTATLNVLPINQPAGDASEPGVSR